MKLTNKHNLPQSLVSAIQNDPYRSPTDISTTTLIRPYQQVALQRRYAGKLSEDVSDMIWPLVGNNTHHIIERVDVPGTVKEWRFYLYVMGWLVGGKIDLWEPPGVLSDWKVTSVWAVLKGLKFDHEAQMNVNAYLMKKSVYAAYLPIRKLQIVNILRDWSKHQVKKSNPDYPRSQVFVQDVPIWIEQDVELYINHRINFHQKSQGVSDEYQIECTPEERWEKPTIYKVRSKNRKTSHRNLDTVESAEGWMEKTGKGEFIETVLGESTRCEHYCQVQPVCKQHERTKE